MTKRDDLSRLLRGHQAGESGRRQDIALGEPSFLNQRQGLGPHLDSGPRHGFTGGLRLGGDIDHVGLSGRIEMR